MQINGQNQASIPILEAIPADAAGGYFRNVYLARAYARAGRYGEAADTLLAITGSQVNRRSAEDAARLLRTAPAKTTAPQQLPALPGELNFVYAYVGALDRVLDYSERTIELKWLNASANRDCFNAPSKKRSPSRPFCPKPALLIYGGGGGGLYLCPIRGADFFF